MICQNQGFRGWCIITSVYYNWCILNISSALRIAAFRVWCYRSWKRAPSWEWNTGSNGERGSAPAVGLKDTQHRSLGSTGLRVSWPIKHCTGDLIGLKLSTSSGSSLLSKFLIVRGNGKHLWVWIRGSSIKYMQVPLPSAANHAQYMVEILRLTPWEGA